MEHHFTKNQKYLAFLMLMVAVFIAFATFLGVQRISNNQAMTTNSRATDGGMTSIGYTEGGDQQDISDPSSLAGRIRGCGAECGQDNFCANGMVCERHPGSADSTRFCRVAQAKCPEGSVVDAYGCTCVGGGTCYKPCGPDPTAEPGDPTDLSAGGGTGSAPGSRLCDAYTVCKKVPCTDTLEDCSNGGEGWRCVDPQDPYNPSCSNLIKYIEPGFVPPDPGGGGGGGIGGGGGGGRLKPTTAPGILLPTTRPTSSPINP